MISADKGLPVLDDGLSQTVPVSVVNNSTLPVTAFGDLRTAELTPQFQQSFEYTVDNTELTTNTITNGGTVTQADAMCVVSTSTTTASTAKLASKRHAKYRAGLGGLMRFTAMFTTPVSATEQYAGMLDENGSSAAFKNGLAIGYDSETFGFHRFANDTKISINQADWDDPLDGTGATGATLDPTKLNVWAISMQYLGAGALCLFWEKPNTGEFKLVHVVPYANANTVPSSYNPNYHMTYWVNNKGTTSDLILKGASYAYFIEGKTKYFELHQPQFSTGKQTGTTISSEEAIVTIRNKSTYASKTNFIDALMEYASVSIEASSANNLGEVRLVRDATLGGTPSYNDINTTNSIMEFDIAGTTVTGGKELFVISLAGKNDRESADLTPYDIILAPGEAITIAGSSANNATINVSGLWKELF